MVSELRAMNSITLAPSNIEDLYDISYIRKRMLDYGDVIRVFLDNNILTRVLNLPIEGKGKSRKLSEEEKSVCVLMGYFVYCGHLTIPDISMYESMSTPTPESRVKTEHIFRYFDHLNPQIYLDLARERINSIPIKEWNSVKNEVKNNEVTQNNIKNNSYSESSDPQKAFYLSLLKAWLIYKQTKDFESGFETLVDWIYENSIIDQNSVLFYIHLFKRNRLSSLIKKINSNIPDVIFKNISNTAWDLAHLNYFIVASQKYYKEGAICFCSRDRLCHELMRISLSFRAEADFTRYLTENYSKKHASLISQLSSRHNNRSNVPAHVKSVVDNLDDRISDMEKEITRYLEEVE